MTALAVTFTKLVVGDLEAAERFYRDVLGLTPMGRHFAGEGDLAQELIPLSTTGKPEDSRLVLSRFLHRPPPVPGEAWIGFLVADVDAAAAAVAKAGGKIVKPAEDVPEHGVRAVILSDPEGHMMELAQMLGAA